MKTRVKNVIKEYAAQGYHRTGTEVDQLSGRWLAQKISGLGVEPELASFPLQRIEVINASLQVAGMDINAVPLFDCSYTDQTGVSGSIGELGSKADIGVVMALPYPQTPVGQLIYQARIDPQHKAIVIVTDERYPIGISTQNAEDFSAPFGPPVIQVSAEHWKSIQSAMKANATASVVAQCERQDTSATNILAKIEGTNSELAPVVIMTPRSGWWNCASERGGGIACLLEMMRVLTLNKPARSTIFTANSGHELGHIGLENYLDANQSLIKDAYMWIHLGANFAASTSAQVRLQYSDETAEKVLAPFIASNHAVFNSITPLGERPLGEARNIYDGGGRYISILGRNGLFHHPDDIWPDAVDMDAAVNWCQVFSQLAVDLTKA